MEENIKDSTIGSANPYKEDGVREDMAALLSRLATLQGVAVPAHRFVYQQEADSGVALEDMAVADQVIAIWGARFPEGPISKLKLENLVKSDYPMLWISPDGEELRLLRGKQNGEYIAESSDWAVDAISEEDLAYGQIVHLMVHQDQALQDELASFSAKAWCV